MIYYNVFIWGFYIVRNIFFYDHRISSRYFFVSSTQTVCAAVFLVFLLYFILLVKKYRGRNVKYAFEKVSRRRCNRRRRRCHRIPRSHFVFFFFRYSVHILCEIYYVLVKHLKVVNKCLDSFSNIASTFFFSSLEYVCIGKTCEIIKKRLSAWGKGVIFNCYAISLIYDVATHIPYRIFNKFLV